jgi:hypothetical protein
MTFLATGKPAWGLKTLPMNIAHPIHFRRGLLMLGLFQLAEFI